MTLEGLGRVDAQAVAAGDIVAISDSDITIGDDCPQKIQSPSFCD
jgi:predicted membrane GTPase involved in stress response